MIRIYVNGYTKKELEIIRDMFDEQLLKLHGAAHCPDVTGCDGCPVRYLCSNIESALAYVNRKLKVTKE